VFKIFHPNIFKPIHTSCKHAQTSTQTHFQTYHYDVENNHMNFRMEAKGNFKLKFPLNWNIILKNCPCASISILFLPQSLSMPLFQKNSCSSPFLCLCFNFVFAIILSMYLFFIFLPFAFFHFFLYASYHLSMPFFLKNKKNSFCPFLFLIFLLSFYLSIAFYLFADFLVCSFLH